MRKENSKYYATYINPLIWGRDYTIPVIQSSMDSIVKQLRNSTGMNILIHQVKVIRKNAPSHQSQ